MDENIDRLIREQEELYEERFIREDEEYLENLNNLELHETIGTKSTTTDERTVY